MFRPLTSDFQLPTSPGSMETPASPAARHTAPSTALAWPRMSAKNLARSVTPMAPRASSRLNVWLWRRTKSWAGMTRPRPDTGGGLGLIDLEHLLEPLHVRHLEVVDAVLHLRLPVELAEGVHAVDVDVPHLRLVLQVHDDAVEAVGDLDAHGVQRQAARLLEVGELGDLLPVEPDFPAQAPGAERGRLPVVLHEADVVARAVEADGFQAGQVELLGVAGVGLEDHLVLVMHLHAVGVLGVAAVVGPEGGLDVGHVPRFGAEDAQHGGRVHGAGADLLAVGLPDGAAVRRPERVQAHDDFLHGGWFRHRCQTFNLSDLINPTAASAPARTSPRRSG